MKVTVFENAWNNTHDAVINEIKQKSKWMEMLNNLAVKFRRMKYLPLTLLKIDWME